MSNQNKQPNTADPVQPQQKLATTTDPNPLKSSIKPSSMWTNTDNPANNIVVSNVPNVLNNILSGSKIVSNVPQYEKVSDSTLGNQRRASQSQPVNIFAGVSRSNMFGPKIYGIIPSDVPKGQNVSGNIFCNSRRPSHNIFAQGSSVNIFAEVGKNSGPFGLSRAPQSTSNNNNIFNTASKPMIATHQDWDEKSSSNGSSQGVRKTQTDFKSLPEKLEMKFKYENPWSVIKLFNLRKFKNGINSSKEHIYLTLERNSQFPEKVYFFVRAKQTKVILFQGFGLKNLTDKITTFMNKEENLKLTVIKQQQQKKEDNEEECKPQFVKEELKIQFENMEDVKAFREIVGEEFGDKKGEEKEEKGEKEEEKKE